MATHYIDKLSSAYLGAEVKTPPYSKLVTVLTIAAFIGWRVATATRKRIKKTAEVKRKAEHSPLAEVKVKDEHPPLAEMNSSQEVMQTELKSKRKHQLFALRDIFCGALKNPGEFIETIQGVVLLEAGFHLLHVAFHAPVPIVPIYLSGSALYVIAFPISDEEEQEMLSI